MFKVIVRFKDLQDKAHLYEVGDVYPRTGYTPSAKRIEELASKKNKRNTALIQEVEEPKADPVEEPQATAAEKPKKTTTTRKSTRAKTKK